MEDISCLECLYSKNVNLSPNTYETLCCVYYPPVLTVADGWTRTEYPICIPHIGCSKFKRDPKKPSIIPEGVNDEK